MMYQVFFYTPESHLELIKQAMFAAGGGRIGHYEACAWQTAGQGRFRPMAGATPYTLWGNWPVILLMGAGLLLLGRRLVRNPVVSA